MIFIIMVLVMIECLFGGNHSGCKSQVLEPHFGYFFVLSAPKGSKMSLARTQNLQFSLLKHHLQTST